MKDHLVRLQILFIVLWKLSTGKCESIPYDLGNKAELQIFDYVVQINNEERRAELKKHP
jgi:hypothetical protein